MNYLISNKKRNSGDSIEGHPFNKDNDSCFKNIQVLDPIQTMVTRGTQMHLMLTVNDTWCDSANAGGWFGIKVNDKVVTRGVYSTAEAGQRIPITLQALFEAPSDGSVTIQAVWCNRPNAERCQIGKWGDAQLTVGIEDHKLELMKLKELLRKTDPSDAHLMDILSKR